MPKIPVISIVDDDQSLREAIVCLMRSLGYAAHSFASAEDFLASPELDRTSCLISDVQMPGMSGIDLQRTLVASGRNIPVILISAFPGERRKATSQVPGAVCFLQKPFNSKALVDCLAAALAPEANGAAD